MTIKNGSGHSEDAGPQDSPKLPAFDIEHALNMFASSFCTMPAEGIYDDDALKPLADLIQTCHIYLIGYTPTVDLVNATQHDRTVSLEFKVAGARHTVPLPVPDDLTLVRDGEYWRLEAPDGTRYAPTETNIGVILSEHLGGLKFEVKYVGQAYGKEGSRNAIDRLLKHETLQKIALKGAPEGHRLTLLLLEVQPDTRLVTMFNPRAKDTAQSDRRIRAGLDKLFNTTEAERVSLYEAALIRYFYPDFNKEFKDSFPSTNLKVLRDCYDKDFSAVVAEICIDGLPFRLWSAAVDPKAYHIARHYLHEGEDRRMFFGLK